MYDIKPQTFDSASMEAVSSLLFQTFGDKANFSLPYLNWQYVKNPNGAAVGFNAFQNDQLAAHYVTIPVKANIGGQIKKGLLSLNTATGPDHRGQGLFVKLANATYEEAKHLGYQFVVGVANQNSSHGFIKRLGFDLVSPLEVRLGVGSLQPTALTDCDFKMSWEPEVVKWRLQRPVSHYNRASDGSVLCKTPILNIRAHMGHEIKTKTAPRMKSLNPIRLWIGLGNDFSNSGLYFKLPNRLKPSPLNLIFKDLEGLGQVLRPQNTQFYLSDFDAY